jgi:hypothetical protein
MSASCARGLDALLGAESTEYDAAGMLRQLGAISGIKSEG